MADDILKNQLDYYRARAQEYDESVQLIGRFAQDEPENPAVSAELAQITGALHRIPPEKDVLELACGTGIWTKELLPIARKITALDGAPEMLDVNRAKLGDEPRVQHECIDLFTWQPGKPFDLVFFAFWLSHVPPDRLGQFLDRVTRATKVGGQVFIVDEPAGGRQLSGAGEADHTQTRQLHDGREFKVIKVYHDPREIQEKLEQRGFGRFEMICGEYFFSLCGTRERKTS
jgi:demethylmenaquinone methyltransferase/2-methoxy-6-polyprenyl-1,4-benzoquinol methylase